MQVASDLTQRGIAALKAHHQEQAYDFLVQSLTLDPTDEQAWLWLSGAVSSDAERRYCLERVLAINSQHTAAQQGLTRIPAHIAAQSPLPAATTVSTAPITMSLPSVPEAPAMPTAPVAQEPSPMVTPLRDRTTIGIPTRATQTTAKAVALSLDGLRPTPQKSRLRWPLVAGGALLAVMLLLVGGLVVLPRRPVPI